MCKHASAPNNGARYMQSRSAMVVIRHGGFSAVPWCKEVTHTEKNEENGALTYKQTIPTGMQHEQAKRSSSFTVPEGRVANLKTIMMRLHTSVLGLGNAA